MLGKWFPREKGKYGWLHNQMYKRIKKESIWNEVLKINKKSDLRHLLSKLNKKLNTLEVKQCERKWHDIDFSNISHSRIARQVDAFMGKSKTNWSKEMKDMDNIDRRLCKKQLLDHIESNESIEKRSLGEDMGKIVQMAYECNVSDDPEKAKMINALWIMQLRNYKEEWTKSNQKEAKFYPVIDVSCSMISDMYVNTDTRTSTTAQVYAAIAIGLSLAYISSQTSVVVFGTCASIIDLTKNYKHDPETEVEVEVEAGTSSIVYKLCDIVKEIMSVPFVGTLSDIGNAMSKFYETYKTMHERGERPGQQTALSCVLKDREYLTIISDFQFSPHYRVNKYHHASSKNNNNQTISDTLPVCKIINEYLCTMSCVTTPNTVLWNMSSTRGFPGLSFFEKTIFISGTNPRDIISTIRPLRRLEKNERNKSVPKKVKGVSTNSISQIDGNHIMWNKTPCYYLYNTMHSERYDN